MWRACSTPAPAPNKFCIFTKVMHFPEVHRRSELSHLSEVRSRQSTTSHNIIRLLRSSQMFLPETEDEACHDSVVELSPFHSQRQCAFFGPSINQMPAVVQSIFFVLIPSRYNVCSRVAAISFTACVYPTCLNVHFLGQA